MRRREFLSLVGGTVVVWPLTARAQQQERMRRIGALIAFAENDPEQRARNTAFLNRLEGLGWKDGRNLRIDYRFSEGDPERMRAHARELVALSPDLTLVQTNPALTALLQHSHHFRQCFRPGRQRLCQKSRAPRRQPHRVHEL